MFSGSAETESKAESSVSAETENKAKNYISILTETKGKAETEKGRNRARLKFGFGRN